MKTYFIAAFVVLTAISFAEISVAQVQVYLPSDGGLRVSFPRPRSSHHWNLNGPIQLENAGDQMTVSIAGSQVGNGSLAVDLPGGVQLGNVGGNITISFPSGSGRVDLRSDDVSVGTVALPGSGPIDLTRNQLVVSFPRGGKINIPQPRVRFSRAARRIAIYGFPASARKKQKVRTFTLPASTDPLPSERSASNVDKSIRGR